MDGGERGAQRRGLRLEARGDPLGLSRRIGGYLLVADLERVVGRSARRGEVRAPRPGGAGRLGRGPELVPPLGLDPRTDVTAVREPGVVAPAAIVAQPALLEQRADDVAPVAQDVHRRRLRICLQRSSDDERRLGRLLHAARAFTEQQFEKCGLL